MKDWTTIKYKDVQTGDVIQNPVTAQVDTVTSLVLNDKGVTVNFKGARPMTAGPETDVEVYR